MAKVKHLPTNEVHILKSNTVTACGFNITENITCWQPVSSASKVTCSKNGCKGH